MFVMPACFNSGDTIYFPFDTYDSNGGSITITGLAVTDIEVYKDGSVTQRSSDNGYSLLDTDGIDFDGTTGLHGFSIDTSDNSDAGFWANGSQYWVNVNAITVDSQTVRFTYYLPLGFQIQPTTKGRTLDIASTGEAGVDLGNVTGTLTQANVGWVDANSRVDVGSWLGTAVTTSSTTSKPEVDVNSISDDATAANNCELMFDGTGYAGGTTKLGVDIVAIGGETSISEVSQQAPPATPGVSDIWMYPYMALRNKIDVDNSGSGYKEYHNDAGTTIWKKLISESGGIYTEAEGVTGP